MRAPGAGRTDRTVTEPASAVAVLRRLAAGAAHPRSLRSGRQLVEVARRI
ncbi:hypothetical protein DIPPA_28780 [Diplonema papillatum]|nr:hypothetical protein DIPPA_28780 [Diplonema papillatum]